MQKDFVPRHRVFGTNEDASLKGLVDGIIMLRSLFGFALFAAVLSAGSQSGAQTAARAAKPSPSHTKAVPPNPADFVGSETCETCHAEVAKNFATNPHSKLALKHGGAGATCESCHGPGKAHVESGGDVNKILQFSSATPKLIDDTCLTCHAGSHANFERTTHGAEGVSCVNCHSSHSPKTDTNLLKAPEPALCYGCHTETKAQFAQPFHHKVDEGLMKCSDCHNPHGTFNDKLQKTSADQNAVCTKCHAETAGPFVYEHPPLKTEGCVSCHFPHGSPNPRLLTRSNVNSLCLQCHTASQNFTAPGTPSFHNQANQYQACTNCHTQIHGSNASNIFFK